MFKMPKEEREKLGKKAGNYVKSEFNYQTTIDLWHDSLNDLIKNWKNKKMWSIEEI